MGLVKRNSGDESCLALTRNSYNPEDCHVPWKRFCERLPVKFETDEQLCDDHCDGDERLVSKILAIPEIIFHVIASRLILDLT